jgi:hypothetical protein|tara:strand:+ start:2181 stop:2300 length:120 start_codon:yes stop_codon:yes gene_type:complete
MEINIEIKSLRCETGVVYGDKDARSREEIKSQLGVDEAA